MVVPRWPPAGKRYDATGGSAETGDKKSAIKTTAVRGNARGMVGFSFAWGGYSMSAAIPGEPSGVSPRVLVSQNPAAYAARLPKIRGKTPGFPLAPPPPPRYS